MSNTVDFGTQKPLTASLTPQSQRRTSSVSMRQPQPLHLTDRSTKSAGSAELGTVLATLDPQKVEILQNVNQEAYEQLARCEANAHLQAADMATLLLRVTAFHHLWCQYHAEACPELCDISHMISKIVIMTKLLAGGSSQHVLQTAEYVPKAAVCAKLQVAFCLSGPKHIDCFCCG